MLLGGLHLPIGDNFQSPPDSLELELEQEQPLITPPISLPVEVEVEPTARYDTRSAIEITQQQPQPMSSRNIRHEDSDETKETAKHFQPQEGAHDKHKNNTGRKQLRSVIQQVGLEESVSDVSSANKDRSMQSQGVNGSNMPLSGSSSIKVNASSTTIDLTGGDDDDKYPVSSPSGTTSAKRPYSQRYQANRHMNKRIKINPRTINDIITGRIRPRKAKCASTKSPQGPQPSPNHMFVCRCQFRTSDNNEIRCESGWIQSQGLAPSSSTQQPTQQNSQQPVSTTSNVQINPSLRFQRAHQNIVSPLHQRSSVQSQMTMYAQREIQQGRAPQNESMIGHQLPPRNVPRVVPQLNITSPTHPPRVIQQHMLLQQQMGFPPQFNGSQAQEMTAQQQIMLHQRNAQLYNAQKQATIMQQQQHRTQPHGPTSSQLYRHLQMQPQHDISSQQMNMQTRYNMSTTHHMNTQQQNIIVPEQEHKQSQNMYTSSRSMNGSQQNIYTTPPQRNSQPQANVTTQQMHDHIQRNMLIQPTDTPSHSSSRGLQSGMQSRASQPTYSPSQVDIYIQPQQSMNMNMPQQISIQALENDYNYPVNVRNDFGDDPSMANVLMFHQ